MPKQQIIGATNKTVNDFIKDQNVDELARSQEEFLVKSYNKTKAKTFFHKLGNSLGLVVVTLPLAGLLAAIGGVVLTYAGNEGVATLGLVLKGMGQTVLSNMGLLFMLAIIIGFTGNKGMAVYAGLLAYIAFVAFSIPFIRWNGGDINGTKFSIWFWHDLEKSTQLTSVLGLGTGAVSELGGKEYLVHNSWQGLESLNTGVLGGICLGFIYVWTYNRFKDLKLPTAFAFFEGEKFVALLNIVLAPIVASTFIIVWPAVNYGLGYIGIGLSYLPFGLDSLLYGFVTRLLLPFEAHPAFYGPLWWTSAGGQLGANEYKIVGAAVARIYGGLAPGVGQELNFYAHDVTNYLNGIKLSDGTTLYDFIKNTIGVNGTGSNGFEAIRQQLYDGIIQAFRDSNKTITDAQNAQLNDLFTQAYSSINWTIVGDQFMTMELVNNNPYFDLRDAWAVNLKVTRFISGGYANDLLIIPTVGMAMWSTLDKEARKKKFGYYMGAVVTCVGLGITEPIEFLFAFSAPLIFFGFYAPFFGLFFGAANLFQVRLGSTFSQGLLDFVVNGIIPTATRKHEAVAQTNIYIPFILGLIGAAVAFPLFRWIFIKFEFAAPGSKAAEQGIGVSTSKYQRIKEDYDGLVLYFGGLENISDVEPKDKGQVIVTVKSPELVVNNAFTQDKLNQTLQKDHKYTIDVASNQGIEYLEMIEGIVKMRNDDLERQVYLKNLKKSFKELIKTTRDKKDQAAAQTLRAKINENIKVFKAKLVHAEKINKINAHWEFKEDQLLNTSEIDKLKYKHTVKMWALSHQQERQIAKADYQMALKLASDKDEKATLKSDYQKQLDGLKPQKELMKKEKAAFKTKLKALQKEKKTEYKKQRVLAKQEAAKTKKIKTSKTKKK